MRTSAKIGMLGLAALPLAGTVRADEVIAPSFIPLQKTVESGTEIQDDRVLVSPEGELFKAGAGTWKLPISYLTQPWSAALTVADGALEVGLGSAAGSYVSPTDLSDTIKAKALIWVDATDTDHLVGEGDAVSVWYDRRETDMSAPTYCRASAYTGYTTDLPQKATLEDGSAAVYFGGITSGQAMEWLNPAGSRVALGTWQKCVKQVFVVYSVVNTYGLIFGAFTDEAQYMRDSTRTLAANLNSFYWSGNNVRSTMTNGRTYLDGERIDGSNTRVKTGLHLLEGRASWSDAARTSGFFGGSNKDGSGGDYICEAIAFTNQLTEAERLQVTDYLMAKWLPKNQKRKVAVELKSGSEFIVAADAGTTVTNFFGLSGAGTAIKSGAGDLVYKDYHSATHDGVFDIQGGKVTLLSDSGIKTAAGEAVSVSNPAGGRIVEVTSATAGELVKTGDDVLKVNGMPAGVETLRVNAGTFVVRPKPVADGFSTSTYEIPVPNGGFEDFKDWIIEGTAEGDGLRQIGKDKTVCNWKQCTDIYNHAMLWERWTGTSTAAGINNKRSTWSFDTQPPEGKCAMMFYHHADRPSVLESSSVTLPETGAYEITFYIAGRETSSYYGMVLNCLLVDQSDTSKSYDFGSAVQTHQNGYHQVKLRLESVPAGIYFLRFTLPVYTNVNVTSGPSGKAGPLVLDDIHLFKVPDDPMLTKRWKIPGGDFETFLGDKCTSSTTPAALDGWTFTQQSGYPDNGQRPGARLTTYATCEGNWWTGRLFNDSRAPDANSVELLLSASGAAAETTFRPPAGRWQLQGDYAKLGSYGLTASVTLSVTIGGTTTTLGTLSPSARMMQRFALGESFETDGNTDVTLKIVGKTITYNTGSNVSGVLFDDLFLAAADDRELFKNGDCEDLTASLKTYNASSVAGHSGVVRQKKPSESYAAFGTETIDGSWFADLENTSAIYEDVYFPFVGRYRLSFYLKSRANAKSAESSWGPNPLRVWIAKGAVTNELARFGSYNSYWVQRTVDIAIDEPGTRRIGLQGMNDTSTIREAHIDSISLRQLNGTYDFAPPFDAETVIRVAEGSKLRTDFNGTNTVKKLVLGGHSLHGVIDPADHPDYLEGTGKYFVEETGLLLLFR